MTLESAAIARILPEGIETVDGHVHEADVGTGSWAVAADGPLGFLEGRRPVATLAVATFRLFFGLGLAAGR